MQFVESAKVIYIRLFSFLLFFTREKCRKYIIEVISNIILNTNKLILIINFFAFFIGIFLRNAYHYSSEKFAAKGETFFYRS